MQLAPRSLTISRFRRCGSEAVAIMPKAPLAEM